LLGVCSSANAAVGDFTDNAALLTAREAFVSAALAGPKNGVAATQEQRADIEGKLNALVALNPTENPADKLVGEWEAFFDGSFKSIYTNTTGASNGKVGPFVGDVWQQFVTSRDENTGVVTNNLKLGPLRGQLTARAERRSGTKMDVLFEQIVFKLFGIPISTKEFGPNSKEGKKEPKGSWDIKYMDRDLRILITNAGNVESLMRTTEFDGQ